MCLWDVDRSLEKEEKRLDTQERELLKQYFCLNVPYPCVQGVEYWGGVAEKENQSAGHPGEGDDETIICQNVPYPSCVQGVEDWGGGAEKEDQSAGHPGERCWNNILSKCPLSFVCSGSWRLRRRGWEGRSVDWTPWRGRWWKYMRPILHWGKMKFLYCIFMFFH